MEFDYNKYSLDELYDVEENIDRDLYPERYEIITSLINERENDSVESKPSQTIKFEDYQDVIEKNYNVWSLLRLAILAIFCTYFMNQKFDLYNLVLGVVAYIVFVALIKYIFFYYHIFNARKIENQIKDNGIRKK